MGMSEALHFPVLDDAMLTPFRVLRLLAASNPDLLDHVNCPYTTEQKQVLRTMLEVQAPEDGSVAERKTFLDGEGDREDLMAHQIAMALEDIQNMQGKLGKLDQKDQIAFLKAKPGLIEKLIELNEKNRGQRAVGAFMRKMYQLIHDELTVDQRTSLIKKLGSYVSENED